MPDPDSTAVADQTRGKFGSLYTYIYMLSHFF